MRKKQTALKRACLLMLACVVLGGGCAPKPIHPAAQGKGMKVINVFYDEDSGGVCRAMYIDKPQKLLKSNQDSLKVILHDMCKGTIDVTLGAAGLPLNCNPPLGQKIPVMFLEDVKCTLQFAKSQYVIRVTETSRASELALDEVP